MLQANLPGFKKILIRKKIFSPDYGEKFRQHGSDIRSVEALSDAVFAFSVSLLVVSLEVPQTLDELMIILMIPFLLVLNVKLFSQKIKRLKL